MKTTKLKPKPKPKPSKLKRGIAAVKKDKDASPDEKKKDLRPTYDKKAYQQYLKKAKIDFDIKWSTNTHNTAALAHFEIIRTLGTGQFGRVMFVKHKKTKQYMALKILERQKVISMAQTEHVIYEKKVLQSIDSPFLVNYRFHFKDNANLYFVLEYVPGGEMFSNLRKEGMYTQERARFYAAQVILAIEYLHYLGVVYRDLKPENLLIDQHGYIKVTDFGFAKKIDDKLTRTACGTPEYLAPEIIKNEGYSYVVDWWSLGILIFEMCSGKPPFASEEPIKIFEKIVNARIKYPRSIEGVLKDICRHLLTVDVTKRLGSPETGGSAAIKEHEWLKNVHWGRLFEKRIKPPYIPEIKHLEDTSNFEDFDEEPIVESDAELYPAKFKDF